MEWRIELAQVALFTRAWIEISLIPLGRLGKVVALFTRAWIEIELICRVIVIWIGRPLHEGVD